jgi:hypothetical protein
MQSQFALRQSPPPHSASATGLGVFGLGFPNASYLIWDCRKRQARIGNKHSALNAIPINTFWSYTDY